MRSSNESRAQVKVNAFHLSVDSVRVWHVSGFRTQLEDLWLTVRVPYGGLWRRHSLSLSLSPSHFELKHWWISVFASRIFLFFSSLYVENDNQTTTAIMGNNDYHAAPSHFSIGSFFELRFGALFRAYVRLEPVKASQKVSQRASMLFCLLNEWLFSLP